MCKERLLIGNLISTDKDDHINGGSTKFKGEVNPEAVMTASGLKNSGAGAVR